jgi:hypothetical protein
VQEEFVILQVLLEEEEVEGVHRVVWLLSYLFDQFVLLCLNDGFEFEFLVVRDVLLQFEKGCVPELFLVDIEAFQFQSEVIYLNWRAH